MAPLISNGILEVLRRSAKASDAFASISTLAKRTPLSPMAVYETLSRRDDSSTDDNPKYNPGIGSTPASSFNNNILLIMFAVIGGLMTLSALWFFLVARHGGFNWRENDWEDYKSTVLRRKGPDGKTLSNATKSTKLGGGSIVPKWHKRWSSKSGGSDYYDKYTDVSTSSPAKSVISQSSHGSDVELAESPRRHSRTPNRHSHQHSRSHGRLNNEVQDPEYNAYRSEKPAAVGGYNKPAEGSHWDYSNTDRSELSGQTPPGKLTRKERKERDKREKEQKTKQKKEAKPGRNGPSTPTRSPAQQASASNSRQPPPHGVPFPSPSAKERNSYYSNYRPTAPTLRAVAPEEQRSNSHRQHRRSIPNLPGSYADEDDYDGDLGHSYTGTEEAGTKSYKHHIPGLEDRSEVGFDDSVSRIGINPRHNPGRTGGFRRGF